MAGNVGTGDRRTGLRVRAAVGFLRSCQRKGFRVASDGSDSIFTRNVVSVETSAKPCSPRVMNNPMKTLLRFTLLACLSLQLRAAQPWREITVPTVAEAAAAFPKPPKEYGAIHWAIWGGQLSKERILADIERIDANGGGVYMINNSGGHGRSISRPSISTWSSSSSRSARSAG